MVSLLRYLDIIEGVAQAFGEKVHPHPDLVEVCKQYFGTDDLTSPKLKMAHVSNEFTLLVSLLCNPILGYSM